MSRVLLLSFALEDNQAALAAMYEGCDNRWEEMKYTQGHLLMASKIKMLRRDADIDANSARLMFLRKPACPKELVLKKAALEHMMDGED